MRKGLIALALASVLGGTGLAGASPKSDGFHFELFGQTYCVGDVQVSCDRRFTPRSETTSQTAMPARSEGEQPNVIQKMLRSLKTAASNATSNNRSSVQ